ASVDQDNNAAVTQNLVADNTCDGTGTHSAECGNGAALNTIAGITQSNNAQEELDAISTQFNNAVISQDMTLLNDCEEGDLGTNDADCENFNPANVIGPITQISANEAGAEALSATAAQSNDVEITQNLQSVNACDEQGDSDNIAGCLNSAVNLIDIITQTNTADDVADDFVQTNLIGVINQDLQATNNCDDTDADVVGDGVNDAACGNQVGNFIGPMQGAVLQTNTATGTEVTDVSQNNEISNMNQVLRAGNDCDQSGPGDNLAECSINAPNFGPPITQTNSATGDSFTDFLQDNDAAFSQTLDLGNNCDATTSAAVRNNEIDCLLSAENFIDPIAQANSATGEFDASIDQDNNAAVTQNLVADNRCSATGTNTAECLITDAANGAGNGGISQSNTADDELDASSAQFNNAVVAQNLVLLNDCDETGSEGNSAFCQFFEPENLIGPITQSSFNEAGAQADGATIDQSNDAQSSQNLQATNDCDESEAGDNSATCASLANNFIDSINQANSANVGDDFVQNNLVAISQELQATNNCDETGDGDNGV
ncbi:MAG TPA: hypothetical protein VHJ59_03740, partial [Nitrososphaera sp.]|nr:hypothetical protein [Nitrososphaera sp.]